MRSCASCAFRNECERSVDLENCALETSEDQYAQYVIAAGKCMTVNDVLVEERAARAALKEVQGG